MEKTIEDSMRKIQESMKNEEKEIELESAANPGNSNFKSYRNAWKFNAKTDRWKFVLYVENWKPFFKAWKSMSSSKVNDQPAVVDLKTNDNGQGKVY